MADPIQKSDKLKILVIEDNEDTKEYLENVLARDYTVLGASTAASGTDLARKFKPDLVISDLNLPDTTGFDILTLLRRIETLKQVPIILISARNNPSDICAGLDHGANDYLGKPFDVRELQARIRARLRDSIERQVQPKTLISGELKLVIDTRDAFNSGKSIELTHTEFDLLKHFIHQNGKLVSRDDLIREIWRDMKITGTKRRTIDVHIRALRKKIPTLERKLRSIYGKGYKYEE